MQPPAPPSFAPPGLSAAPGTLPPISQLLSETSPPPPGWLPSSLHALYLHGSRLPIVDYYRYLLHTSPALLGCTLAVNWLLPVVLESLPWYLSRRQLSKLLRDSRNAIQHRLISSDPLSSCSLLAFALMSVMYSLLHSVEEMLRSRLMLLNRLKVRRMLIERILYSEVGSLQSRYALSFGGGEAAVLRTETLEAAVFNDMNDTLQLFNSTLPAVFRSAYSLSLSGSELYRQRHSIHLLSILRPSVIALASEAVSLLHSRLVLDTQSLLLLRNANAGSRLVSNIVDGLGEIQVSNGQDWQLQRLDRVSREEADGKQGLTTFLSSTLHAMQGRGVLDFVSEVAVVKAVMESSGLSHEQYRAVQNDIDYLGRLIGRIYSLGREAARTLDSQHRVMAVLNLPTFRHETTVADRSRQRHRAAEKPAEEQRQEQAEATAEAAAPGQEAADAAAAGGEFHFEELVVRRLWFRYGEREPWALRIGSPPAIAASGRKGKEQVNDDDDAAADAFDSRDGRHEEHIAADNHSEHAALCGSVSQPESSCFVPAAASRSSSSSPVLRFQRGKTYAIIGQNRSGKSTLVQILCKLRIPPLDTEPLIDINPSATSCASFLSVPRMQFRSVLSYIPQRPFIFPGSIEDNVRMANTRASRQEVEDAARRGGVFLFDRQTEADDAKQTAQDSSSQLRRDVTVRKPWQVNRVADAARQAWRWLQAVWDWSRPEGGEELDDNDDDAELLPLQPLLMEDEMMGATRTPLTAAQPLPPLQLLLPDAAVLPSSTTPAVVSPDGVAVPAPSLPAQAAAALSRSPGLGFDPSSSSSPIAPVSPSSASSAASVVLSMETAEGGSNLSGGFAQSVALSRVFLRPGSELLILDESMSSMDPIKTREHIVPQLLQWVRERRHCLLLVTHDVRFICPLVDCVYVMEAGRLRQSGSHAALWQSKAQPYCRMYGEQ